jgi:two-component system nitrogen regulation response regulator NtrX
MSPFESEELPPELLGASAAVLAAVESVQRAVAGRDPVLIVAERGFSAERIGRAIARRMRHTFLTLDCETGSPDSVLRDLFGRAAGRRTDVETVESRSLLARARGGTLLLASITQLPAAAQLRLWRVLRDGELRIGATTSPLDVRVIGATQPGLEHEVADHRFRRDLYDRLQRIRVDVPPLRDRRDDLPTIIQAVLAEVCRGRGIVRRLAPAALTALAALPWPGNLDELRLVLDRLATGVNGETIRQEDVLADLRPAPPAPPRFAVTGTLREARLAFEREYIAAVLQEHGWRMSEAARTLGIERANLYRKTRQLGITRAKPSRVS